MLKDATDDKAQNILRKSLATDLLKLMRERGVLIDPSSGQAVQPDAAGAPEGASAPAAASQLL